MYSSKKWWEYHSYLPSAALGSISMWMELENIFGETASLSPVLHGFMFVCLATKTLPTSWCEEMLQRLLPTRAVHQGSEKRGVYSHRGTAPGNRGGMCRPETVNLLKDPWLLLYSLLHNPKSSCWRGNFSAFPEVSRRQQSKGCFYQPQCLPMAWSGPTHDPSFIKDCTLHLL